MALSDIFKRNRVQAEPQKEEQRSYFGGSLNYNTYSSYTTSTSMRLSAVYCAVDSISDAVATLPINVFETDLNGFKNINYQHPISNILNVQPSANLSRYNFYKLIVSSIMLKGNGYAVINRDSNGNAISIKYIQPELVTIVYNQQTDTISYYVVGYKQPIASTNMLHFWRYSNDNINGLSIINYAVNSLAVATDSEKHASNFFKSGAASGGVLIVGGTVKEEQIEQIKTRWNSSFATPDGNGVAVISDGIDYKPVTINAKDAQLLESRQFNVQEIARFFKISPVKLFDLTHASYSNLESTQLSFLQDTVNPYLVLIEQELNRKLFTKNDIGNTVQFDRSQMLSTDKKATAEYYKQLLVSGIITINDARKALGYNDVENGNNLFMQLNMATVDNLVNQTPADVQKTKQQQIKITDNTTNDTTEPTV